MPSLDDWMIPLFLPLSVPLLAIAAATAHEAASKARSRWRAVRRWGGAWAARLPRGHVRHRDTPTGPRGQRPRGCKRGEGSSPGQGRLCLAPHGVPLLVFLAAVLCPAAFAVEPGRHATVYLKPARYSAERDFHSVLRVELLKRKGVIPITVSLTNDLDEAELLLEVHLGRRDAAWHEGFLTTAQPTAIVSVVAFDHCERPLFVKTKGDMTIWGPAGPVNAAQKMALSFKEGLWKKKSRLNKTRRESPCLYDQDSGHYIDRR